MLELVRIYEQLPALLEKELGFAQLTSSGVEVGCAKR